jgi:putative flippase GtrA
MKRIAIEFLKYIVVGGLSFLVDWSLLREGVHLGMHYMLATALGFCAGLLINFLLCILWIWRGSQAKTVKDFAVFAGVGLAGLGLTELGMWIGVGLLCFGPSPTKIVVAGFVLIWNFTLRRILVFSH